MTLCETQGMTERPDRPRFIEPAQPARSPEEAKRRRSTTMISVGVLVLIVAALAATGGSTVWLLPALLGVGLLVGGLVIR